MNACFKIKTIVIFMLILFISLSAEVLDLSKKTLYDLGEGELLKLKLDFPKGSLYDFNSSTNSPFNFKKISVNKIEVTFDATKIKIKPETRETYQASFGFTKKNIGRKSYLTVKAAYNPPVTVKPEQKSAAQNQKSKATTDQVAQAQAQVQQTSASMQQTADQVKKVAQSASVIVPTPAVAADSVQSEAVQQVIQAPPETLKVFLPAVPVKASFPWLYLIIITILLIAVIILVVKQMVPKHEPLSGKYEEFYKDVATIMDINIKGRSIDNCSEEIIHRLLDCIQPDDGTIALIKSQNGVEKRLLGKSQDPVKSKAESPSMSSEFIDPNYKSPYENDNFDLKHDNTNSLKTKKPSPENKPDHLNYQESQDDFGEQDTKIVEPINHNKIHSEVIADETAIHKESIEEKRKKIEEMLGKKKFG